MSIIATALKHLIAAGVTGDDLVRAVAEMEAAAPPIVDRVAEKRRAYDRERKRRKANSTGNPPEAAESAELVSPNEYISNPHPRKPSPIGDTQNSEVDQAVEAWNAMAKSAGLPEVRGKLEGPRLAKLRQRLKSHGLAGVLEAVAAVARSPFLRGETSDFRADFKFFVRPENFTKLLEGGFEPKAPIVVGVAAKRPMNADELRNAIRFAEDHGDHERAAECKAQLQRLRSEARPPPPQIQNILSKTAAGLRASNG